MKYEVPKMEVIRIFANDVITTSGILGGDPTDGVGGDGKED